VKKLIQNVLSRRVSWFLIGLSVFPSYWLLRVIVRPTALDAMGFVGFYEESYLVYTFLGDHSYTLSFPGDRAKFLRFASRMGLDQHKVSENEFLIEDPEKQWSQGVKFNPEEKLTAIQYFSSSQ